MIRAYLVLILSFLVASTIVSAAQTIGYAEAIDRLARSCGADINKFCKKVNLGGGRVQACLDQNAAKVSAQCKITAHEVRVLIQQRVQARVSLMQVCDIDIRRLCPGVQPGDGNLLECFYKARQRASPQCQAAVVNAGY